jgi:hypothetical protein
MASLELTRRRSRRRSEAATAQRRMRNSKNGKEGSAAVPVGKIATLVHGRAPGWIILSWHRGRIAIHGRRRSLGRSKGRLRESRCSTLLLRRTPGLRRRAWRRAPLRLLAAGESQTCSWRDTRDVLVVIAGIRHRCFVERRSNSRRRRRHGLTAAVTGTSLACLGTPCFVLASLLDRRRSRRAVQYGACLPLTHLVEAHPRLGSLSIQTVAGLWDILRPTVKREPLRKLAFDAFQENQNGVRGLRLGIDASIWLVHANWSAGGGLSTL